MGLKKDIRKGKKKKKRKEGKTLNKLKKNKEKGENINWINHGRKIMMSNKIYKDKHQLV